jgi:two-component system, OmpR family, sensor histidine kinase QseC
MQLTSSIRQRIVAILIGLFVVTWLTAFAATYAAAARRIGVLFDAQLAHDAGALLVLAEQEPLRGNGARRIPVNPPQLRKLLAFAVWRGEGLMLRSYNAPDVTRPDAAGYANTTVDGVEWRGYALLSTPQALTVWVGEPFMLRDRMIDEITRDLLLPMLLALPLLAVAVWWGVGRGLKPLARVAAELEQRSPSNLEPVGIAVVPSEINTLVEKLDDLLVRLREAFERERRFTADAAHEIRTPLAGIRTHAQIALKTTQDAQRRDSLAQVIDGVDRITRLVEQLLTLARLDHETLEGESVTLRLDSLANEVLADMRPEAEAKRTTLTLRAEEGVEIKGHLLALGILLRNLVDNAIRYTPAGGNVEVKVAQQGGRVALNVTDNGPGIPLAERARSFDRFYRGRGVAAFGCGLGLSIVRRVAELHGADIELADATPGQGLHVTVWLPRPAALPAG